MKSLFLKIFLSFWVAFALFLVLAILVTLAFRPRTSSWEGLLATALNDSVKAYEEGGSRGLRKYLQNLESTQHVRVFLFNENMEEMSHGGAPDWAVRVAGLVGRRTPFHPDFGSSSRAAPLPWATRIAYSRPVHRHRFFWTGLLSVGMVLDHARGSPARSNAPTGCG